VAGQVRCGGATWSVLDQTVSMRLSDSKQCMFGVYTSQFAVCRVVLGSFTALVICEGSVAALGRGVRCWLAN
jgi:hypothetical protein